MNWHDMMLGDWVRAANIVLATYAMFRGGWRTSTTWVQATAEARLIRLALTVSMFAIIVGSAESAYSQIPPGLRTYVTFLGAILGSVAFSLPERYRAHGRIDPTTNRTGS